MTKSLTIQGDSAATTILNPTKDTGTGGDARARLVDPGVRWISPLDGTGYSPANPVGASRSTTFSIRELAIRARQSQPLVASDVNGLTLRKLTVAVGAVRHVTTMLTGKVRFLDSRRHQCGRVSMSHNMIAENRGVASSEDRDG